MGVSIIGNSGVTGKGVVVMGKRVKLGRRREKTGKMEGDSERRNGKLSNAKVETN